MSKQDRNGRGAWGTLRAAFAVFTFAGEFFLAIGIAPASAQTLVVDAAGRVLETTVPGTIGEQTYGPYMMRNGFQTQPTPQEALYGIGPSGFAYDFATGKVVPVWDSNDPDPFIDTTNTNDRGIRGTSAATGMVGAPIGSHTTDVGGGGNGNFNYTKSFSPGVGQTFTIGALVRYNSLRTSFDDGAFTAIPQTAHQNVYTAAGIARYQVGNTYLAGYVAGDWGTGDVSGSVTTGHFSSQGSQEGVSLGHVFSLFDPPAQGSSSLLPTKAPPKGTAGSPLSALQLDVSANVGYATDTVNAFTDNTGFAWGDETMKYWQAGGQATLFERLLYAGYAITPFAGVGVESQFDFSHTLGIPNQPTFAVTADTISLGSAQTFWTERLGVNVTDPNGWQYSVEGFYSESSEYRTLGVRAGFHMPIARWLGLNQTASR